MNVRHVLTNNWQLYLIFSVGILIFILGILLDKSESRKKIFSAIPILKRSAFCSLSLGTLLIASGLSFSVYSLFRLMNFVFDDSVTLLSILIGIIFGIFSLASFNVARRIEKNIRHAIDNFADFTEYMQKVMAEPVLNSKYRMAVIYPYFGLLKSVNSKLEKEGYDLNKRVCDLVLTDKINILMGNKDHRNDFLKQVETNPDIHKEHFEFEKDTKTVEIYLKKSNDKKFNNVKESYFENPIHIVIAEKTMVWGSVDEAGFCKGFYSKDKDIVESYKKLFDILFNHK